jgi:hypothetical protein
LAVLVLATSLPALAQTEPAPRPYSLQEIRLGTSLSELRRLRFLDSDQRAGVELICSPDKRDASHDPLSPLSEPVEHGMFRCALFDRQGGEDAPATMEIFAQRASPAFVMYRGRHDSEPRLYQISVRLRNDHFQDIINIMRRAYGQPYNYQIAELQTTYGDMLNATYYWNNGVSGIEADLFTVDLNMMSIVLTDNEMAR